MIVRPPHFRPIPQFLVPSFQTRCLHQQRFNKSPPIPRPTPFVPDVQTFLTLIGRGLSQHASKIPTWKALFSLTSPQLKELGIEPPRNRRYLLRWRQKFRHGQFGPGGDLKYVENGAAEIRIAELPAPGRTQATATATPGTRKAIVNVPAGKDVAELPLEKLVFPKGFKIQGASTIAGPRALPVKGAGTVAKIAVTEGLWEDRRGHKIDGGERRQAAVRAKRRSEERKTSR